MKLSPSCAPWESQMKAGAAGEAQIVQNLIEETCLSPGIGADFCAAMEAAPAPAAPAEARALSTTVVARGATRFLCQGHPVDPARFAEVARLFERKNLPYYLGEAGIENLLARNALDLKRLLKGTREEVELWLEVCEGPLHVSARQPLVWLTESAALPAPLSLAGLIDRLGLDHDSWDQLDPQDESGGKVAQVEKVGLVVSCRRADLGQPLSLPSALDGIDYPRFQRPETCTAPCGKTQPNTEPDGLPEAVSPPCKIPSGRYSLQAIV
jgi:hypothetical protein